MKGGGEKGASVRQNSHISESELQSDGSAIKLCRSLTIVYIISEVLAGLVRWKSDVYGGHNVPCKIYGH